MQWDLGLQGLALLAVISMGFGAGAAWMVGRDATYRLWAAMVSTVACFGMGLVTSEGIFGWATEEDLQPNVDGLSRDEVLLSSLLTTAVVVLVMRYLNRRRHASLPAGSSVRRAPAGSRGGPPGLRHTRSR